MKDFRDLTVWNRAHALVLRLYEVTAKFPKAEVYGLASQLRRSAASVPANIAEGCGRVGDAEFVRFLYIAMGSASETEYHLILAKDLGLIDESQTTDLFGAIREVKRMLASLITRVRKDRDQKKSALRQRPHTRQSVNEVPEP